MFGYMKVVSAAIMNEGGIKMMIQANTEVQASDSISTTPDDKTSHLILIVNENSLGNDIIEAPSSEGGIRLGMDEDDVIDLAVTIQEEIVPLYYCGNWGQFLIDLLVVVKNAKEEGSENVFEEVEYFLHQILAAGKRMVA